MPSKGSVLELEQKRQADDLLCLFCTSTRPSKAAHLQQAAHVGPHELPKDAEHQLGVGIVHINPSNVDQGDPQQVACDRHSLRCQE